MATYEKSNAVGVGDLLLTEDGDTLILEDGSDTIAQQSKDTVEFSVLGDGNGVGFGLAISSFKASGAKDYIQGVDFYSQRKALVPVSGGSEFFDNTVYTIETFEPWIGAIEKTGWYKITPTERSIFLFRITSMPGSGSTVRVHFYKDVGSLSTIFQTNLYEYDYSWYETGGGDSRVLFNPQFVNWTDATVNTFYEWQLTAEQVAVQIGTISTSQVGTIAFEWQQQTKPPNDDWEDREVLEGPLGVVAGTTVGATWDTALYGDVLPNLGNRWPQYTDWATFGRWIERMKGVVWYSYTPEIGGQYEFTVTPTSGATWLHPVLFQGDAYVDLELLAWSSSNGDSMQVDLVPGVEYTIGVAALNHSNSGGQDHSQWRGTFDIEWQYNVPPDNDDDGGAEILTGDSGSATLHSLQGATYDPVPFANANQPYGVVYDNDVWYAITPATTGWFELSMGTVFSPGNTRLNVLKVLEDGSYDIAIPGFPPGGPVQLPLRAGEETKFTVAYDSSHNYPFYSHNDSPDFLSLDWAQTASLMPTNDDWANAEVITGSSGSVSGTLEGATFETPYEHLYYRPTVWYSWVAPTTGFYRFTNEGDPNNSDLDLAAYTGTTLADLLGVAYNYDGFTPFNGFCQIGFKTQVGVTYYIQVSTFSFDPGQTTDFVLTWEPSTAPTHDTFATANELPSVDDQTALSFSSLGAEPELEDLDVVQTDIDPDFVGATYYGRDVWHKWTAPRTSVWEFSFLIDGFDGFVVMYRLDGDPDPANLTWMAAAEVGYSFFTFEEISFNTPFLFEEGVTYYFRVLGESYETRDTGGTEDAASSKWITESGEYQISWVRIPTPAVNDDLLFSMSQIGAPGNLVRYPDLHYDQDIYGWHYDISSGGAVVGSNFDAGTQPSEVSVGGFGPERTVWYWFEAPSAGTWRIWVESDELNDMVIAVYGDPGLDFSNPGNPGTFIASDDDSGAGNMPLVEFAASQFDDFLIQLDSKDDPGGEFTIRWVKVTSSPPANDDWENAIEITADTGTLSGSTVDATVQANEPSQAGVGPNASVWYVINSPVDRGVTLTITAGGSYPQSASISVWEGDSLETLVEPNAADFFNPWSSDGIPETWDYQITAGVPLYIRVMSEFDGGTTFDVDYDLSSLTPPAGDDIEDPVDSGTGAGDTPGDTEGSTVNPSEPDYQATVPFGLRGTVWHRFVPDYDGVYHITVERNVGGSFYQYTVWRGETFEELEIVPPNILATSTIALNQYKSHVLRAGETYMIRIERWQGDAWGPYTLHIRAFPEYDDWTDSLGYDSLTGTAEWSPPTFPETTGGVLTCSGAEGYATVEPWGPDGGELSGIRWYSVRFKMRVTDGEAMWRENFGNYLGVLRVRDDDGETIGQFYLVGNKDGTQTFRYLGQEGSDGRDGNSAISFGTRGKDFDGWVDVEITFVSEYTAIPGATITTFQSDIPDFHPAIACDGVMVLNIPADPFASSAVIRGQSRYFDFGAYRYPTGRNSQQEFHDTWTIEFKDVVIRGRPTLGSIPATDTADMGIVCFDGWGHGDKLDNAVGNHATISDAPGLPVEGKDWADWKAVRLQSPGSDAPLNGAATQTWMNNPHPWVGFWLYFEQWPESISHFDTNMMIAGFGTADQADGWASLWISPDGELRLAASRVARWTISDCVGHLQLRTWYWIEMDCDVSVPWDSKVQISINGVDMGTYSFSRPWAELMAGRLDDWDGGAVQGWGIKATVTTFTIGRPTGWNRPSTNYGANVGASNAFSNEHFYVAHFAYGRATPYPQGAMVTQLLPGISHDGDGVHGFPELPEDHQFLHTATRPYIWCLYGYTVNADGAEELDYLAWSYPHGDGITIVPDAAGPPETDGYTAVRWQARDPILQPGAEFFGTYMGPRVGYIDHSLYTNSRGGKTGHCSVMVAWVRGEGTLGRLIIGDWVGGTNPGIHSTSYTLTTDYVQHWCAVLNCWALLVNHPTEWIEGDWDNNDVDSVIYYKRPRLLIDPLLYPRFALSTTNGATWTWLTDPTTSTTHNYIGDDVSLPTNTGIWLDNAASLNRIYESQEAAVLPNWTEVASVAYQTTAWYLEYNLGDPPIDGARSYNLIVRGSGYNYVPSATQDRVITNLYAQILDDSNRRPLAYIRLQPEQGIGRGRVPTDAGGGHWDNTTRADHKIRFGFYRGFGQGSLGQVGLDSSPTSWLCTQFNGSILNAVQWEALVQAEPGVPATPCAVEVPLINSELIRKV